MWLLRNYLVRKVRVRMKVKVKVKKNHIIHQNIKIEYLKYIKQSRKISDSVSKYGRPVCGNIDDPSESVWVKNRKNVITIIENNTDGKRADENFIISPQLLQTYPLKMKKNQICVWLWTSERQSLLSFHLYFLHENEEGDSNSIDVYILIYYQNEKYSFNLDQIWCI